MTLVETGQMLHLFRGYWPTFVIESDDGPLPGTIRIWADALKDYHSDDARRACMVFQGQKDRTAAPTISEFEGLLRDFHAERHRGAPRLSAPGQGEDDTEHYQENGRWYVRMSRKRYAEVKKEMSAKGFYREEIPLPGGRMGYRDRRE